MKFCQVLSDINSFEIYDVQVTAYQTGYIFGLYKLSSYHFYHILILLIVTADIWKFMGLLRRKNFLVPFYREQRLF
jgi:hypothetical protein